MTVSFSHTTTITIDRPVYGEWVTIVDSGTGARHQDRPLKGWQPTEITVPVYYSDIAGYVFCHDGSFHAKMITGSLKEIETAYTKMEFPRWETPELTG